MGPNNNLLNIPGNSPNRTNNSLSLFGNNVQQNKPVQSQRWSSAIDVDPASVFGPQGNRNSVSISVNPNSGRVNFNAPQWFLDSQEFQTEFKPLFDKLEGASLDDTNVKQLLSSDSIKQLNSQLNDSFKTLQMRNELKVELSKTINNVTDKAAQYALYNMAQASRSDNDDKTQLITGTNADGTLKTESVKTLVQQFKGLDDTTKGRWLRAMDLIAKDSNRSPEERAATIGLQQFFREKGLADASDATRLTQGLQSFVANADKNIAGQIWNQLTRVGNLLSGEGNVTQSELARRDVEDSNIAQLEGLDTARMIGSIAGEVGNVASDIASTAAIGSGILAGGRALGGVASNLVPRASTAATNALKSISESAPKLSTFTRQNLREVPANLAFGTSQALTRNDYDFANNFLLDTVIGAGALGAGRVVKQGLQALEGSATAGKLADINDKITRGIYTAANAIEDIPGIGKAIKGIGKNLVSSTAQLERGLRRAYARGDIDRSDYLGAINTVKRSIKGSSALTEGQLQNSEAFRNIYNQSNELRKTGETARQSAIDYTTNRMILENIEAGRYNATKKQRQQVEAAIAHTDSPAARAYYDNAVALNDEITRLGTEYGILDEQIIEFMKNSPDFANRYIHLQFDVNSKTPYTGQVVTNRAQRGKQPVKRIRGLTENSAVDPMLTAVDRLGALNELKLQNDILVRMKDLGLANVVQDASLSARRNQLRSVSEAAGKSMERSVARNADNAAETFAEVVDDLEDPLGSGLPILTQRIDDYIDDIAEGILGDTQFLNTVMKGVDTAVTPADEVALEVLRINRAEVIKKVDEVLDTTELGAEARRQISELVDARINAKVGEGGLSSTLTDNQSEIRELNKQLSGDNTTSPGEQTADYFQDGGRGKLSFNDPDVEEYFTSNYSLPETTATWKALTLASRAFRAGTTGLNPIFNLFVNPARDIARSALTAGTAVVTPRSVTQSLIETTGMSPQAAAEWYRNAQQLRRESLFNSTSMTFARSEPNRAQQYKDLEKMAERWARTEGSTGSRLKSTTINLANPKNALRNTEDFFAAIDQEGIRRNVFDAVLQRSINAGKTPDQALQDALFYADEATTSFWRAGQHTRQFVRTVPYLSAAINGQASFLRLWSLDPIGVTARLTTGIAMPATVLTINNLQNENYQNIPNYVKDTNFIIMQPDGSYLKIPMDYDIARVVNPFRDVVEGLAESDLDAFQILADAVLNSTPIDLSGFTERDLQGRDAFQQAVNGDGSAFWKGTARAISGLSPQLVSGIYEAMSGQDLYTGNAIGPTDTELYERGYVDAGDEITDADRTFASRNSQVLGWVANALGIPQSRVQGIVSNFTGQVGEFIVNALDKATGAPAELQGGRDIGETLSNRFGGDATTGGRMQTAYYDMIEDLENKKAVLQARIGRIDNAEARQRLIDEYGEQVAGYVDDYNTYFSELGGLEPYQLDSVIRLLNLNENDATFAPGTYQNAQQEQVAMDARTDAERRAFNLGIPTSTDRDRVGRIFNNSGETSWDFGNVSTIPGIMQADYYGAPQQLAYEFNQIVAADRATNKPALYQEMNQYYDRLNDLYAEARGKKGAAATAIYDRISAVQEEYMTKVFDTRIKPLIDKYGPSVLDNRQVLDELASLVMVPGDFTPFASKNKQPYLTDDTRAYLLDRYGVGKINQANRPSDEQALRMINAINSDLDAGRTAAASSKFDELTSWMNAGRIYVNQDNLATIEQLIRNANRRR